MSIKKVSVLAFVLIVVSFIAGNARPAQAYAELAGVTDGGACYKIVVPDNWNGDLVFYNHGYDPNAICPVTNMGELADVQLGEGYAIAASGYREGGWALFHVKNDLQALYGVFTQAIGTPHQVFVSGASLGGIVSAFAIEKVNLGNLVGAYTYCGVMGGSRVWDFALDTRLLYDVICKDVPGAFIPGGASGLPRGSTRQMFDNFVSIDACFGMFYPAGRTPEQQARLQRFVDLTGIPESFILIDVGFFFTLGIQDLVFDQLQGNLPFGNRGVSYGDPQVDADIERVSPHPGAQNRLSNYYLPTGAVGKVKIVAAHTDKDGLVIVEHESEYASIVPPQNFTPAVVVEDVPSHCGFTPAELLAGWESLRAWVGGSPQPTPSSISAACADLLDNGVTGPCRYDPSFVIPDMDGRVRPRPATREPGEDTPRRGPRSAAPGPATSFSRR